MMPMFKFLPQPEQNENDSARQEIDDLIERGCCHYKTRDFGSKSLVDWSDETENSSIEDSSQSSLKETMYSEEDSDSNEYAPLLDAESPRPPMLPMFFASEMRPKQTLENFHVASSSCRQSPVICRSPSKPITNRMSYAPLVEDAAYVTICNKASQFQWSIVRFFYLLNNFILNKPFRKACVDMAILKSAQSCSHLLGFWFWFAVVPTLAVLLWCSVPIPHEKPLTFVFFLFWYYGLFNLVSIIFLSRIFKLFAIKWWPATQQCFSNEFLWNSIAWVGSLLTGYWVRRSQWPFPLFSYTLTWFGVTLSMQLLPIGLAVVQTAWRRATFRRRSLTLIQRTFVSEDVILETYRRSRKGKYKRRASQSFRRFSAFCTVLLLSVVGLALANTLASAYIARYPHSSVFAGVAYNTLTYSLVYLLDTVSDYLLHTRVKSRPLQYVFRLYFYMIYFMFYRLLFTRLQTPLQFVTMQTLQALWINLSVPLTMTTYWHSFWFRLTGYVRPYDEHVRNIGRSYFLRNVAESASLFTFLCCLPVLHLGPNAPFYPLYQYDDTVYPLKFSLTMIYALIALFSEQATAFMTRRHILNYHKMNILSEAKTEIMKCQSLLLSFIFIIIMVQMDTIISLFNLSLL